MLVNESNEQLVCTGTNCVDDSSAINAVNYCQTKFRVTKNKETSTNN